MIKKLLSSAIFCICAFASVVAQEVWSLEKCITYAQQNSLTMKQAEIGVENTRLTEELNKMQRMPTLNADASGGYSFGRTIDPTTNTFQRLSRGTNGFSLSAGYLLFNGGRINNSIKQSKLDVAAQKAETEDISNNIALNVAAAYLNVLFAEEQLLNATTRLQQTQEQLKQTDRLIQAGTLPENERLQILAQIAQDEQQVVTQENSVAISYLSLKNLLLLEPNVDLKIVKPTEIFIPASASPELYTLTDIYGKAIQNQPIIRARELQIQSAGLDVDIAKSGMLPSISLFGNIRTDFATGVPDPANIIDPGEIIFSEPQPVQLNGSDGTIAFLRSEGLELGDRTYFDQLNDNFGQSVGVSLNIPIYNRHQNKISVERARLNIINAEIALEQSKQQLKADVQRAIADAKAAKKQLDAAQKSVNALEAAYENTKKRFDLGAANTFEFTSAKNQVDLSKVDLTIAKYDYLYKLKIVDFYQGKKITL